MRLLRSVVRRRVVGPDRLLEALRPLLGELEEMLAALGADLADDRWTEAAQKLRELVEVLKRPSAFYTRVRAAEQQLEQRTLDAIERASRMMPRPPRKGQARAQLPMRRRA